jgi:hypothetical protein
MQIVIVAIATFLIGTFVGILSTENEPSVASEINILEQKNAMLERENEELREANEDWYEKSQEKAAEKRLADEKLRGLYICIGVLASIIAVNTGSMYSVMLAK